MSVGLLGLLICVGLLGLLCFAGSDQCDHICNLFYQSCLDLVRPPLLS